MIPLTDSARELGNTLRVELNETMDLAGMEVVFSAADGYLDYSIEHWALQTGYYTL